MFCCGGRLMTGPEPFHLAASVLLLLGPCLLFYQAVLPLVAAGQRLPCGAAVSLLLILSLALLFMVACTDPGIIPRGRGVQGGRINACVIRGQTIPLRWCSTCRLFRPPRAKHCFVCNNCVACFDHHCPWISNCVGLRNRRAFFVFLFICTSLTVALAAGTMLAVLAELDRAGLRLSFNSLWHILTTRKVLGALTAFCLIAGLPLLNLLAFNCYLIAKNLTTAEEFHQPYGNVNPFSQGWNKNCYLFWCSKTEPGCIDFRALAEETASGASSDWHCVVEPQALPRSELRGEVMALPVRVASV